MQHRKGIDFLSTEPSPFVRNSATPSQGTMRVFTQFRDLALQAYIERTPYALQVIELLRKQGGTLVNDHVALRTFNDAHGTSGKDVLERLFTTFGYKREDNIKIPGLYLDCHWYEPPQSTNWPKLFISEQQVQELPNEAKEIVYSTVGNYYAEDPFFELGLDKPESVDPLALCLALEERPWRTSYRDYQALLALTDKYKPASGALQYTAWTLVHGHRWNHFTILLNTLGVSGLDTLEDLNAFLKENGFPLNKWGERELQGSTERLLKQSSTKANLVEATFSDGVDATVPGSFVEFIERFQGDSGPFRGFLADNARGIFASTNARD